MGDKRSTLSATVFEQHCRRGYTLLFRAGTVLLFVMYSWRWDIHHSCCVGQTWLSNSSRVKSSWSTIPFFPLTCFLPEARKPKTSAHLVPLGNIGIFNNMLWKKKKKLLHPSFGRAPTSSKILHSTPNPRHPVHTETHTQTTVCHTHTQTCVRTVVHLLYTHSLEPPSSYELHYSDPSLPFISLRMFMQCVRVCV